MIICKWLNASAISFAVVDSETDKKTWNRN